MIKRRLQFLSPLPEMPMIYPVSWVSLGLGGVVEPCPLLAEWWVEAPKVRISSSPLHPHSGGAPSADGGHGEVSSRWIIWDPVDVHVHWCGCRCDPFDLCFHHGGGCCSGALALWGLSTTNSQPTVFYNKVYQTLVRSAVGGTPPACSLSCKHC
jgi:hypothetical protein